MAAATTPTGAERPQRRMLFAGPVVAIVSAIMAVLATDAAGLSIRDPDHVAGRRMLWAVGFVLVLVVLDVVLRAGRRDGFPPSLDAVRRVRRERWTLGRGVAVAAAVASFYVSYLAYRNLKSVVPLLRPGDLFDRQLADLDRSMFGGNDPAELLHTLLGTGLPTHVLSTVYMLFFLFIPATLALALVFSPNLQAGLFYATAQSLNWVLGAVSYFLVPSMGPIYFDPAAFANLPVSGVTRLQDILLNQRIEFLDNPSAATAQSIAAFSSLHVSIFFTAAVAAHLLGLGRRMKTTVWVLLGLTSTATIYFGWHYVLDDFGGLIIGLLAITLARALTGFDLGIARRLSAPRPSTA